MGRQRKEAIPAIVSWLAKHEDSSSKEVENLGLGMLSVVLLESIMGDLLKALLNRTELVDQLFKCLTELGA